MDIFGLIRVTWLPRARPLEPDGPAPEPQASEPPTPEPPPLEPPASDPPAIEPPPDVLRDLIGLADDLVALAEKTSGSGPSPGTLRLLQRRVDRLLDACGVQILSETGPVVASRHEVIEVRTAGTGDTEGWIASTVRRGYLHGDRLIRPQQVVAYAAGPPARTEGRNDDEG
jgi:hypothetical protein